MEPVVISIIAVIGSAFLSLLRSAVISSRRAKLRLLAEQGKKNYLRALKLIEKTLYYEASLRAGLIFIKIFLDCYLGIIFYRNYGSQYEVLAFAIISFIGGALLFFLTEIVSRTIAEAAPEKITAFFSWFIMMFPVFNFPLLLLKKSTSTMLHRFFPASQSNPGMTEDELYIALLEGEKSGIVESKERSMVEGVFYLGDRPASTFMTHRSEIKWLDIKDEPEKTKETLREAGEQQYFPVIEGELDEVKGIISTSDLMTALLSDQWPMLENLMHTPFFIPETMPALKAFEAFKKSETGCLFVMDEYGGFAGILTVNNLIEEIVGQLSVSKGEEEEIIQQEDGKWLMDGSTNIDEASHALSLSSLVEEGSHNEYHTLAGFILNLAGEIPKTGAHFDYLGFRFIVVDMDGNRIDKVMVQKLEDGEN